MIATIGKALVES